MNILTSFKVTFGFATPEEIAQAMLLSAKREQLDNMETLLHATGKNGSIEARIKFLENYLKGIK
jgi:hypothetical protein